MTKAMYQKDFEAFVDMRLNGRSDIVYRAYDLLAHKGKQDFTRILQWLGLLKYTVLEGDVEMVLMSLQQQWSLKYSRILQLDQIRDLIHEFFVWWRLSKAVKRKWPYRDVNDARRLYEEDLKAKGLWYKKD